MIIRAVLGDLHGCLLRFKGRCCMDSSWQDEYQTMIDDCENRESRLSDWDRDFIGSISNQLKRGLMLSKKQIETLEKILERVTKNG
jgi:hypothetical protein